MKLIDMMPGRMAGMALVAAALIAALSILVIEGSRASRDEAAARGTPAPHGALVLRHAPPGEARGNF